MLNRLKEITLFRVKFSLNIRGVSYFILLHCFFSFPSLYLGQTGPCALVSSNLQFMKNVEPFKMELVIVLVLERQGGKIQLE